MTQHYDFCQSARTVIQTEGLAISHLLERVGEKFTRACEYLLQCEGRIVVLGMGKSGHIGGKIAATLASTGSPAFFVHPGEAGHGDLGMIVHDDVVLAISNSGSTREITLLLPTIKTLGIPLITLTGRADSPLAEAATVNLDVSVPQEACPLGLAPTASTTATLVMGDALAVALMEARGFTSADFARSHPCGTLGNRLLLRVTDVMHAKAAIPKVLEMAPLPEALLEMTQKNLGMTTIVTSDNRLIGVFTDGDLRRTLQGAQDIRTLTVNDVMTSPCKSIPPDLLAAEALQFMEEHQITALPVTDNSNEVVGVIHLHDLLGKGRCSIRF